MVPTAMESGASPSGSPPTVVRVYIGGLPHDTNAQELNERFGRMASSTANCRLVTIDLPQDKLLTSTRPSASKHKQQQQMATRGFAYLTLEGTNATQVAEQLMKSYHKTKWRGSVLKMELAQPDYQQKLQLERETQQTKARALELQRDQLRKEMETHKRVRSEEMRLAVSFTGRKTTVFCELDSDLSEEEKGEEHNRNAKEEHQMESSTEAETDDASEDEQAEEEEEEEDNGNSTTDSEEKDEESTISSNQKKLVEEMQTLHADADNEAIDIDDVEVFVQQVEREEANARRIAALEAKQKQKEQMKKEQQQAVKIDASSFNGLVNKKITFDDSGNEADENDEEDGNATKTVTNWLDSSDDEDEDVQIPGAFEEDERDENNQTAQQRKKNADKALNFFNMEGNEDDDNEQKADQAAFAVRPEFLGEKGKKLFELQKRFGGDQRFRLDARFMEDEDNEYGGNDDLELSDNESEEVEADGPIGLLQNFQEEDNEDKAAALERESQLEQDRALSVIAMIFPDIDIEKIKYRLRAKSKKDPIKEASWMGQMKRYDPRDAHSRQEFELSMHDKSKEAHKKQQEEAEELEKAKRDARQNKDILIGGDRFFATSNSLGSLFTRVRKNSEDGIEGEAALDGVFGFARPSAEESNEQGAGAATFKLSSLFDFPVEDENDQNKQLASMGEHLFEDNDNEADNLLMKDDHEDDDERMEHTDNEEDDDDGNDEDEADETDQTNGDVKKTKTVVKKSLSAFLAFGRTFVAPASSEQNTKEWTERRKKLTIDFKRKRKEALKNKKKQQQRLQKAHQHKKQKTVR